MPGGLLDELPSVGEDEGLRSRVRQWLDAVNEMGEDDSLPAAIRNIRMEGDVVVFEVGSD